eukprot:CAMPEP_0185775068 /NCGR_PEP_ID=MMETSP1174-20130828/81124_1 /TAXON_ID=35687 /ORGANISM="Dictyocha speculum, Strain CCMP1381" /LENGTH=113 /DNA_ID=CAMNT_0028462531 /DNA_START=38 /DNA_END=379 /DNA_ORIENTATION=+
MTLFVVAFSVSAEFYICENENPLFLGTYKLAEATNDGVPAYVNDDGMSIFRHQGFWYIGDLAPWPPQTFYRCVDDCAAGMDSPPAAFFKGKKVGTTSPGVSLTTQPCEVHDEF